MSADRSIVVVDTNVLLAATDRSRASHLAALSLLNEDERMLAITPQIVREYLVVGSRPVNVNGLGLSSADATRNVDELLRDMQLLEESYASLNALRRIVASPGAAGKQIHDANIVAVALAHRANTIVTDTVQHFERFSSLISIESLD